jgi:acetoacetyl-CoA synthetase
MSQPTASNNIAPGNTTVGVIVADHDTDQLPVYTPTNVDGTGTFQFLRKINNIYGTSLKTYSDLYQWSIDNIDLFWSSVWDDTGVVGDKGTHVVDKSAMPADNPSWFSDSKLNWAENMLWCRSPDKVALIEASEFPYEAPLSY